MLGQYPFAYASHTPDWRRYRSHSSQRKVSTKKQTRCRYCAGIFRLKSRGVPNMSAVLVTLEVSQLQ